MGDSGLSAQVSQKTPLSAHYLKKIGALSIQKHTLPHEKVKGPIAVTSAGSSLGQWDRCRKHLGADERHHAAGPQTVAVAVLSRLKRL